MIVLQGDYFFCLVFVETFFFLSESKKVEMIVNAAVTLCLLRKGVSK